jgi:hypothetical protein
MDERGQVANPDTIDGRLWIAARDVCDDVV